MWLEKKALGGLVTTIFASPKRVKGLIKLTPFARLQRIFSGLHPGCEIRCHVGPTASQASRAAQSAAVVRDQWLSDRCGPDGQHAGRVRSADRVLTGQNVRYPDRVCPAGLLLT